MDSPITIMPVGTLFRVTYCGKSTECDWAEMIALISSITIPLKLHIAPPASLTIERPCLDWLKDEIVQTPTTVVNRLSVALTPQLTPAPAADPSASLTTDRSRPLKSITKAAAPALPRLADVGVSVDDNDAIDPEPAPLPPPERRVHVHISDPDTFYEHVDDQKWGALEEQVFRFIARNGCTTSGAVAAAINEHSVRVGRSVSASKRLHRVGGMIHIKTNYLPIRPDDVPPPTKGKETRYEALAEELKGEEI